MHLVKSNCGPLCRIEPSALRLLPRLELDTKSLCCCRAAAITNLLLQPQKNQQQFWIWTSSETVKTVLKVYIWGVFFSVSFNRKTRGEGLHLKFEVTCPRDLRRFWRQPRPPWEPQHYNPCLNHCLRTMCPLIMGQVRNREPRPVPRKRWEF